MPGAAEVDVVADVGGSKLLLRALAPGGEVLDEERRATGPDADGAFLDEQVAAFAARQGAVASVGVAVPGLVDAEGRVVVSDVLPRLAGWGPGAGRGVDLVVNDVRASLAAARSTHPEVRDLVVVVVGTGIAAAVLSGGRMLGGTTGWAGELGSVPVDLAGGTTARLDDLASGRAVTEAVRRPGAEVAELVAAGDAEAVRVVRDAGRALGRAVGGVVTLLNPARVVLAGGTTRYPGYVDAVQEAAAEAALPEPWAACRLTVDADPGTLVVRGLAALLRIHRDGA
ncbi:ROK family protein [Phycicoccus sonneratiae]|uniref:ROK family protein n=1 Tax=Phycicoccus sonneratiae TaxID=2807628 RepID=A0ABS2CR44_9MICO|nr:ROK family protein [Phycicoccus sonneraticus]MBM6402359.1 ROK family protein [Phycicoccus sonneraticus]